jgi:hypothetical protein
MGNEIYNNKQPGIENKNNIDQPRLRISHGYDLSIYINQIAFALDYFKERKASVLYEERALRNVRLILIRDLLPAG